MGETKPITLTEQHTAALFEVAARLRRFGTLVESLGDACAILGIARAEEGLGETVSCLVHSAEKIEQVLEAAGGARG